MNQNSKELFKDSYETIVMYYGHFLHLGYFFDILARHNDLLPDAKRISLETDRVNKYELRKDVIELCLKDISVKSPNFFSWLILNNSIRGITMAVREALGNDEIKKLFLQYIFRNDKVVYDNFKETVRFIRNIFSHNISDRMKLSNKDYEHQKASLNGKRKSTINFFFDYAKSPIPIAKENYTVKIDIDFNQINDTMVYSDIIPEYQSLLFIELCYNCIEYLKDKL